MTCLVTADIKCSGPSEGSWLLDVPEDQYPPFEKLRYLFNFYSLDKYYAIHFSFVKYFPIHLSLICKYCPI